MIETTEETRGAFRVEPLPKQPIPFLFMGKRVDVLDISSGGISFKNDEFPKGKTESVKFKLPGDPNIIETKLEIVRIIPEKNICCSQFVDLNSEQEDQIVKYVLERQKYDLRKQK